MSKRDAEQLAALDQSLSVRTAAGCMFVYANAIARSALADPGGTSFPAGSVIAKEKLLGAADCPAEAVAFMIKHERGQLPESGGWEFRYYPAPPRADYTTCVECHRTGASRDYVFGRLTN